MSLVQSTDTLIGSYELIRPLAEGGMAQLFLGRHVTLDQLAAIKILHEAKAHKPHTQQRFWKEAHMIAAIHHPNIVQLYEFGQTESGATYLALEYVKGVTLANALKIHKQFSVRQSLRVAEQLAGGLAAVHNRGIAHRDLKPSNIMLIPTDRDDTVNTKILDFGIAKYVDTIEGNRAITKTGVIIGTPRFMSPEQCLGSGKVDHRTDMYSLGVILYRMLTGSYPYSGIDTDDMLGLHLHADPVRPSQRRGNISDDLDALIMRCLEKRPDDRFQTMKDLAAAVRQVLIYETSRPPTGDAPEPRIGALARRAGALADRPDSQPDRPRRSTTTNTADTTDTTQATRELERSGELSRSAELARSLEQLASLATPPAGTRVPDDTGELDGFDFEAPTVLDSRVPAMPPAASVGAGTAQPVDARADASGRVSAGPPADALADARADAPADPPDNAPGATPAAAEAAPVAVIHPEDEPLVVAAAPASRSGPGVVALVLLLLAAIASLTAAYFTTL